MRSQASSLMQACHGYVVGEGADRVPTPQTAAGRAADCHVPNANFFKS